MSMASAADTTAPMIGRTRDADGIVTLTFQRPERFNTLSREMLEVLQGELEQAAADNSVRAVVLAGEGKAFCAGHDLKEMAANRDRKFLHDLFEACSRLMMTIPSLPVPVIARIDGIATAAGCQLVAACDLAICTNTSRFATSGVKYGLFCSTPMVALSRNVPRKAALEMLMTGDFIDAAEAHRLGLVNQVVEPAEMDRALGDLCARLVSKPRAVLAKGKRAFYRQLEMPLSDAYAFTSEVIVDNALDANAGEGFAAFAEKRPPVWPGQDEPSS